jgi:transposase
VVGYPDQEDSPMITREGWMDIRSLVKQGYSQREIAKMAGLHRVTVKKYLEDRTVPVYRKNLRASALTPYHGMIGDWLTQQDYRATRVYDLVQQEGFAGSYDVVRRYVKTIKEDRDRTAYIRFETLPGRQAQVDFGDFQVTESDGTTTTVYCFVMVLGHSRHFYIEFLSHCTMSAFLACHQNAFGFFGGIPAEILYDNMKNVVIRRLAGTVQWNGTFAAFCGHYGYKPLAAPPYAPWVKGKVERPMDYIRERFWRGYAFRDLDGANHDVLQWVRTTAYRRVHGTTREPVCDRFERERPHLGALPHTPFDIAEKLWRKVYKDCQVAFGSNRYVVAHECVGRKVLLKIHNGMVRIYKDDQLVVVYRIPEGKGITVADPRFYARLKADREQQQRKYSRVLPGKGKATRGLLTHGLSYEVMRRSLSVYDQLIGKEVPPCPH